jgi:hypothetical protein
LGVARGASDVTFAGAYPQRGVLADETDAGEFDLDPSMEVALR